MKVKNENGKRKKESKKKLKIGVDRKGIRCYTDKAVGNEANENLKQFRKKEILKSLKKCLTFITDYDKLSKLLR